MTEHDPIILTMTCFDCEEHVDVTIPGAETAARRAVNRDKPFRTRFEAACPKCGNDMSRVVTLWVESNQIILQLDELTAGARADPDPSA